MLTRADVERIVENVLSELKIEVTESEFSNSNSRTITLKWRDRIIDTDYFDVIQSDTYDR